MLPRLVSLLVAVAASAAAAPTRVAIPLVVDEAAGVARHAWPATASVPLPRGRVRGIDGLVLASPTGRPTPAQLRVLERWPDGSARWLLVDFLADVPAHAVATYTLRDGHPEAGSRPRLRRGAAPGGGRTLDTGVVRVTVGARDPSLELAVDGRAPLTVRLPALVIDGAPAGTPVVERVEVETDGEVRTEVVIRGRYPQGLAFETRVAGFAGQPFVRLEHTLTNLADAHYARIRSLAFTVPAPVAKAEVGIDGGSQSLEGTHELVHASAAPAELDGEPAGQHADGWVRATTDGRALTIATPYFWQEYPKAIGIARDRVSLDLFAGKDDPVAFGTGAAKTHELWIALEPAAHATPPADLAAALAAPLVALPPSSAIVASGALPQALDRDAPGAHDFLGRLASAFGRYRERVRTERWDDGPPVPCSERKTEHPRVGLYGALNWGDWQFPGYRDNTRGCDGWGNLEYDLPQVLALAWAATESRMFLDGLGPAARHYRDVDVIHHAPGHPDWVGMNHPHKALHFAFESKETVDLGHTWTEGLVSYWRFTGDARALAAARGIADAIGRRVERARNPRQFGWPMIALVAVYDATGERRYLDAAREFASAAIDTFRPTPAAGDWKMGILADGLAYVHAATGDDRVRRWLVAYANTLVATPDRWPDARYSLPLGYLATLTGDARYEDAAFATVRTMKIGEWGKPLAAAGRTGFRILAPLQQRAGLRPSAPTPRSPSPAIRRGRDASPPASPPARRPPSPSRRAPARPHDD